MRSVFTVWFRGFFRPKLTTVKVLLYENGKPKSFTEYPDLALSSLLESIDELWESDSTRKIWFETELYEKKSLFQKERKVEAFVTCYCSNQHSPDPYRMDIPHRYRKAMFDKIHALHPRPVGQRKWADRLEVRFVIPK